MRLINITSNTKSRIKEMITTLIPAIGYVRITRRGLVVMKKRRFALRKEILNVTDVCISLLPKKIAEHIPSSEDSMQYTLNLVRNLQNIIYMSSYSTNFDIVDYMWKQYTGLFIIPIKDDSKLTLEEGIMNRYIPEIHFSSHRSTMFKVLGYIKKLKKTIVRSESEKLLKKAGRMIRLPKLFRDMNISLAYAS